MELAKGILLVALVTAGRLEGYAGSKTRAKEAVAVTGCAPQITNNRTAGDTTNTLSGADGFSSVVYSVINSLCSDEDVFGYIQSCMESMYPSSGNSDDRLLKKAFNSSRFSEVKVIACRLQSVADLNSSVKCITTRPTVHPKSRQCTANLATFFKTLVTSSDASQLDQTVNEFCRTWGTMVSCVSRYIDTCDKILAADWSVIALDILTESCRAVAKPAVPSKQTLNILSLLNTGNSSVISCGQEFDKQMVKFMPTGMVSQYTLSPDQLYDAINSTCGDQLESFLRCLEQRSRNTSSAVDSLMFHILNVSSVRLAYTQLCDSIPVITDNTECLINATLEMRTCRCYLTNLNQQVREISSSGNFSFSRLSEPFCSFFVSFAECFVGLIGSCSHELGILMENVYLGGLTDKCRGANGTSCPSSVPASAFSGLLECGAPVDHRLRQISANTSDLGLDDMQDRLKYMVMETYRTTCNKRHELLDCLEEWYLPSESGFDLLLKDMFNFTKIPAIGEAGCSSTLLSEVEDRLQFILTSLMGDPAFSGCVDNMAVFSTLLEGGISAEGPERLELFCGAWGNFVECLASTISCSSVQLASTWTELTMSALTHSCRQFAQFQQGSNTYMPACTMDPGTDSAVSVCLHQREVSLTPGPQLVEIFKEEINFFCDNGGEEAMRLVGCLRESVSASAVSVDVVFNSVFTIPALYATVDRGCSQWRDFSFHMDCIEVKVRADEDADSSCLDHIKTGFHMTAGVLENLDDQVTTSCRSWHKFVECVDTHIQWCDDSMSRLWKELAYGFVSPACHAILTKDAKGANGVAMGIHTAWTLVTLTSIMAAALITL